ncbi:hypothetical protein [Streptomyces sp. KAU_LT]|uniref:hypothetical protein n=1 Tax=Streptomyces sp. KAU_LT TaxID=3046669 RepID=UPI0024B811BE|nr:hypothetical protein [Streptomyces sp. KAU_LT]MDI9829678.1 hypothetical protein [Streptomyces sp. KAU_LT]
MAIRTSPSRTMPGNALGGVLRDLDTRARIAGRRRTTGLNFEQDPGPEQAPVHQATGPAAAVLTTGEDGRARWEFPAPYGGLPACMAVAVDPEPGEEERTVVVALEEVTTWCLVVRVWRTRGRRGAGVAEPAGAGVAVHVSAQGVGGA